MLEEWEDYKQQMDEVLLSRGESKTELGFTLTKGMTKEDMFEALKSLQEKVRMEKGYYEKDDGELSDEVIEKVKSESSATDTSEDKFDQRLF